MLLNVIIKYKLNIQFFAANIYQYKDYIRAIEKGYWNGNMKYCRNITNEWLGTKKKNINKIITHKDGEVIKYKGKEYMIDNYHTKIDFKNGEIEFAEIIAALTNKKIELFPRFDYFKSADSKIGREYVDFKITTSGTDKFIYGNITEANHQADNYIFWIKNKEITDDIIKYQVDNVFRRLKYVKEIGIFHNDIFNMYARK